MSEITFLDEGNHIWQNEDAQCNVEVWVSSDSISIYTDTSMLEDYMESAVIGAGFAEGVSIGENTVFSFNYSYEGEQDIYITPSFMNIDGKYVSMKQGFVYAVTNESGTCYYADSNGMLQLRNGNGTIAILTGSFTDYTDTDIFYGMNITQLVLKGTDAKAVLSGFDFSTGNYGNFEGYKDVSFTGTDTIRIPSIGEEIYNYSINGLDSQEYYFEKSEVEGCYSFSRDGVLSVSDKASPGTIYVTAVTSDGYRISKSVNLIMKYYNEEYLLKQDTDNNIRYPFSFTIGNKTIPVIHISLIATAALTAFITCLIYIGKLRKKKEDR